MDHPSIFVANDDPAFVELIAELFMDAGYPKAVWHVGQGAFHRIRDEQPDLVLLDINLVNPGRGWSTLDALSLHPKTQHIPVILCATDMRLLDTKADLLRNLGCQSLEKPFDIETLLAAVAAAIGPRLQHRCNAAESRHHEASGVIQRPRYCCSERCIGGDVPCQQSRSNGRIMLARRMLCGWHAICLQMSGGYLMSCVSDWNRYLLAGT
jgi:DNA-binding response OmpR family regulator